MFQIQFAKLSDITIIEVKKLILGKMQNKNLV